MKRVSNFINSPFVEEGQATGKLEAAYKQQETEKIFNQILTKADLFSPKFKQYGSKRNRRN